MVASRDIDSAITLELSGDTMTSGDFRQVVTAFDGLLKAVTKSVLHDGDDMKWAVRLKSGSILLGFDPVDKSIDVGRIQAVLAQVLEENAVSAEYPDAARQVCKLSGMENVRLWVGKKGTPITKQLCTNLKASLQAPSRREPYQLPGVISGRITTLSEKRGLIIQEPIWGKRIRCSVPKEQLDRMRTLWRKRVMAEGIVHYGSDGYPTKIDAKKIDPIPDDDELPSYMDVFGILKAG